jgi:hypothetical protein
MVTQEKVTIGCNLLTLSMTKRYRKRKAMNTFHMKPRQLLAFAAIAAVAIAGCQRENIIPGQENNVEFLTAPTPEEHAADMADMLLQPVAVDATDAVMFGMNNDGIPTDLGEDAFDQRTAGRKVPCRVDSLSERQAAALRKAKADELACLRDAEAKLRQLNREHVARAEKQRQDLMDAYRNGRITREELQRRMAALNASIRENMAKDPARQRLIAQIQLCHENYLKAVKAILTPRQWAQWSRCNKTRR